MKFEAWAFMSQSICIQCKHQDKLNHGRLRKHFLFKDVQEIGDRMMWRLCVRLEWSLKFL